MTNQKQTLVLLLLLLTVSFATAQITTVRRYNPNAETSTAKTTTKSPQPATYSNTSTGAVEDGASRRAAALSKVQGTTQKSFTAKGLSPAQYSTDGSPTPVEYSAPSAAATTMTVNGLDVQRKVKKGVGQEGNDIFTPVAELHFVQFAVYCKDTPVDRAPAIEGLMLLWHSGSKCPGGATGASYIVKGYNSADEAKDAVLRFKSQRIDCWYNPSLTGAEVEVIGVR
ncbi:MAG: hypothetical protein R3A50_18955 [Saprospiraceae bacterium]|nr:hypothetical protein [Saprospiraceae bacterium]MCB9344112.1 hypothetical protein [Lewinellaceae bacterium]